jgi:alpha-L-fucosidase 2
MGLLLWGETSTVRLSLDRGDLWDERPSKRFAEVQPLFTWRTMQGLVASNRMDEFHDLFDSGTTTTDRPPNCRPGGELTLDPSQTAARIRAEPGDRRGRGALEAMGAKRFR